VRDVLPIFLPRSPIIDILAALCPFHTVRIVINDGNAPRHDDIVTDHDTSVAYDIASPNECAAADLDFAAIFLKTYVGMDDRVFSDRELVPCNALQSPPRDGGAAADPDGTRTARPPSENAVDQRYQDPSRHVRASPASISC
jgi:hypothetical protein